MKPNYDKLTLGSTLEAMSGTPTSSVCHNYGIVNGCDEGCPALLDGDCEQPEEALEVCDISEEDKIEILSKYRGATK